MIDTDLTILKKFKVLEVNTTSKKQIFSILNEDSNEYKLIFYHEQDCCEYVRLVDFKGTFDHSVSWFELNLTKIEIQKTKTEFPEKYKDYIAEGESYTFTTVKFLNEKSEVMYQSDWLGSSNGYYNECVQYTLELSSL